jgi:hypothetical protein
MINRFGLLILLLAVLTMVACGPKAESGPSDAEILAGKETAQANLAVLPPDVPIHENAVNLRFAASNTYISYEVLGTLDDIVVYYQDALRDEGWEKRNNSNEESIGGAVTLLRGKPDRNISVTIQLIPESEFVRVLLSVISR